MPSKMMKIARYDLFEDIKMRLHNSILMFDGVPHWIKAEDVGKISLMRLDPQKGFDGAPMIPGISPEDPRLSLSSPPLGYANYSGLAFYIARIPARRQKQGLDTEALVQTKEDQKAQVLSHTMRIPWQSLYGTIMNEYPSLKEVVKELQANVKLTSMAFHRKLCLVKTPDPGIFQLSWATKRIGLYSVEDNTVSILSDYSHASVVNKLWGFMNVIVQPKVEDEPVD